MWTPEYFVRYVELPLKVDGVTVPNDDGTFDIYINVLHPEAHQRECLEHEVWHITHDHFYNEQPVSDCERDAKKAAKARRKPQDDFWPCLGTITLPAADMRTGGNLAQI